MRLYSTYKFTPTDVCVVKPAVFEYVLILRKVHRFPDIALHTTTLSTHAMVTRVHYTILN